VSTQSTSYIRKNSVYLASTYVRKKECNMSKKKFKNILCGCITALCLLLTSCGSLQISQGSGNQDSDRGNQTTTETTFASTGQIESVDTLEEVPEYTGNRADLIKEGYEPCSRCKP